MISEGNENTALAGKIFTRGHFVVRLASVQKTSNNNNGGKQGGKVDYECRNSIIIACEDGWTF